MKFLGYLFNGFYQFLGGTTTVLKVVGIFSSAFLLGIIIPVILPITIAAAVLIGGLTIVVDAYKSSKMRKQAKLTAEQVAKLAKEVEALREEQENKKRMSKSLTQALSEYEVIKKLLTENIAQIETTHQVFCDNIDKVSAEKLPIYASHLYGCIGDDLDALLHDLNDPAVAPDLKLQQLSDLRMLIRESLQHETEEAQLAWLINKAATLEAKKSVPAEHTKTTQRCSPAVDTEKKQAIAPKESFSRRTINKVKSLKTPLGVAIKTSLMMFALSFGVATLGVAVFVGAPMMVATTMTTAVLAFSVGLLATSLGLGLTTAYFHNRYVSPEQKNFKALDAKKQKLLQEKKELQLSCKRYDKKIDEKKTHLKTVTDYVGSLFTTVGQMFSKFQRKLSIRAKPNKLSAEQAQEIIKYAHPQADKQSDTMDKLNKNQLSSVELQALFEQLPSAKQAMLMAKWHEQPISTNTPTPTVHP